MQDPNVSGGNNPNPGGASGEDPNPKTIDENSAPPEKKDTVSYETYSKLLDEKKKRDAELAEFRKQIDDRKAAEKNAEESKLRESGEFQKLLKLREEEIETLKTRSTELEGKLSEGEKRKSNGLRMRSFLDHLSGELDEPYWALVDLSEIPIDPSTGLPDKVGAMKAARDFEQKYPLVLRKKGAGGLPTGAAQGGLTNLTYDQWLGLPDSERAARMKDVDKSTM